MLLVKLWVEYTAVALDRLFTYACFDETACRGKRAEIVFNGKKSLGFIEEVEQTELNLQQASEQLGYSLGVIERVLDQEPLINEELFAMAEWLSKETISSRISCFQAMLPAKLKPSGKDHRIKMEQWVRPAACKGKLTAKQEAAWNALKQTGSLPLSQWRKMAGSVGKTLEEKGWIERFEKEARSSEIESSEAEEILPLTPLQQQAKEAIEASKKTVVLLHGVTGSGKTEVYLQMAQEVVNKKKQVLILVPEISLTPQMVQRVKRRFPRAVAIYHSGLNNQQKYEQFKRVQNGEVAIVVGTRSAVFMPFQSLGLIIMDEEHDSSYKQDNPPQYHCRDAALWRAQRHHCKLLLGSATPSLDSYARALKGVYDLVTMPERINATLPKVVAVNMRQALRQNESYILSDLLKQKITERLKKQEQVMLLLNRRGYSPTVRCTRCLSSLQCPHCDVTLSWHRAEKVLKCHSCGYTQPMVQECPNCHGNSFKMLGIGTQRLAEEVLHCFPDARIDRMDADTTQRKGAHEAILQRLENHETDILIGTQIIAKGMDYPDVTLVGIINGDAGLNRPDYRSVETTFQLIVQAAGRSGRAEKSGEVVIQAFDPDHYAIRYGVKQDYTGFFVREMNYRRLSGNPPYSYLISVVFSGEQIDRTHREIHHFAAFLREHCNERILGPAELFRLQDRYRFRLILKGKNRETMMKCVREAMRFAQQEKMRSRIRVDTSPMMLE